MSIGKTGIEGAKVNTACNFEQVTLDQSTQKAALMFLKTGNPQPPKNPNQGLVYEMLTIGSKFDSGSQRLDKEQKNIIGM